MSASYWGWSFLVDLYTIIVHNPMRRGCDTCYGCHSMSMSYCQSSTTKGSNFSSSENHYFWKSFTRVGAKWSTRLGVLQYGFCYGCSTLVIFVILILIITPVWRDRIPCWRSGLGFCYFVHSSLFCINYHFPIWHFGNFGAFTRGLRSEILSRFLSTNISRNSLEGIPQVSLSLFKNDDGSLLWSLQGMNVFALECLSCLNMWIHFSVIASISIVMVSSGITNFRNPMHWWWMTVILLVICN